MIENLLIIFFQYRPFGRGVWRDCIHVEMKHNFYLLFNLRLKVFFNILLVKLEFLEIVFNLILFCDLFCTVSVLARKGYSQISRLLFRGLCPNMVMLLCFRRLTLTLTGNSLVPAGHKNFGPPCLSATMPPLLIWASRRIWREEKFGHKGTISIWASPQYACRFSPSIEILK